MAKRETKRQPAPVHEDLELRTLPHNLEAERSVLGAVIMNNHAFEKAVELVRGDDFFRRAHRAIFEAMLRLIDEQKSNADPITLTDELRRVGQLDEVGGPAYIAALTDGVPRTTNVGHYAAIVKEASTRRALIKLANAAMLDAYDAEKPAATVINETDKAIIDLQRGATSGRLLTLAATFPEFYTDLANRSEHRGELSGVDTGYQSINDLTYGWQAGDLIVVAARPSIGKTAFVLNTSIAAARAGKRVALFSLEMRRRQLEYRILSTLSGVLLTRLISGYETEADFALMADATEAMAALPIAIDDRGGQSAWDIRSACRRQRAEAGLDLVIIDYVQLMPGTIERRGANRNEEVTDISRRIKALADECSVPILLLSQLNRGGEGRADKRPILSDLRESGALEQDADLVCFLHRRNHRESGTTNFIIEKQRNGPTGTVNLTFNRDTQTFIDGGEDPPLPLPAEKPARPPRRYGGGR